MNTTINEQLELTHIQTVEGNTYKIIMATALYGGKTINVTWNCKENNLVVHEWYDLTDSQLANLTTLLSAWFKANTQNH